MAHGMRPADLTDPIFSTVRLAGEGGTALMDHLDILRDAVSVVIKDRPFAILAWVVLPDHMHAVWAMPRTDPDVSQRWARIKARFSRDACRAGLEVPALSPRRQRKGGLGVWQRGFASHRCTDATDLDCHLRYCWTDPVRHGLVQAPTDWIASSIHRDIRAGRVPPDITNEGTNRRSAACVSDP